MLPKLLHWMLHDSTYQQVYGLTVAYFAVLYFGLGPLFLGGCRQLAKWGLVHQIRPPPPPGRQVPFEIRNSVVSMLLFGFSGVAMVYLVRQGVVVLRPDTLANTVVGLALLTLWNEVHFFGVHRLLHLPFLYRRVHYVHHRSKVPTVFSVYSFHWFEALLLSTVPLTIAPWVDFSATAILLYPLASILLNFAGHCNYRFGDGRGRPWSLLATRHGSHHHLNRGGYGFATDLLDRLEGWRQPTKK